ncbi:MAG: hypothetical protein COB20_14320 [SAR86 cluster bacterium]|uniref:AB hydrolase-1 domain-containing protein n=1 Tax=SAR86 cluster bacterium TaxID=2030880 RepID=A0A2A4WWN5_9GAMM|nr:MAG: hypothetical protein COB20_14320 [SAR86 cluster bacterium]
MSAVFASIKRISLTLICVLVLLPITFMSLVGVYSLTLRTNLDEKFPPPGKMVDIGSHRLHIHCTGEYQSATVLLEAGAGAWSTHWTRVQSLLSNHIRVCSYDRAGLGWSEKGPLPRDDRTIAAELDRLLLASEEAPPYVLVGWSGGGPPAWLYAKTHPDVVMGVVMVESVTKSYRKWSDENASITKIFVRDNLRPVLSLLEITQRVLFPTELPAIISSEFSEFQKEVLAHPGFRSRMVSSSSAEGAAHEDLAYMSDLGDTPLIVLEAGRVLWPISEIEWRDGQRQLLIQSTNSKHIVASSIGHNIPMDAPEIVVKAIEELIQEPQVSE